MKQTRIIMGMPVTIEIRDLVANQDIFNKVFEYLIYVDNKFSTYKSDSEISLINQSRLSPDKYSADMKRVLELCEQTKKDTSSFFDICHNGQLDPSGLVKGWAIKNASKILSSAGYSDYCLEIAGDMQVSGLWKVGIKNPFNTQEIVKVINIKNCGIATSGNYERGAHVYNPVSDELPGSKIVSLTVIAPDVYEADRFATAAFAMGESGIEFISRLPGFAAYQIDNRGQALFTSEFEQYVVQN